LQQIENILKPSPNRRLSVAIKPQRNCQHPLQSGYNQFNPYSQFGFE